MRRRVAAFALAAALSFSLGGGLGQTADDVGEYKTMEVTVYEGTDVVALTVVPIDLTINLASEDGVADAIRALASPR